MTASCAFPCEPGVYALLILVEVPQSINVGKWGTLQVFPGDTFVYVGSAMNGLSSRLDRHLATSGKRLHWHVDHLLSKATVRAVLFTVTIVKMECTLSGHLASCPSMFEAVPRFGNSDCTRCPSHLYRLRAGTSIVDAVGFVSRAFEREGGNAVIVDPREGSNHAGERRSEMV